MQKERINIDGILVLDKPQGYTSNAILQKIKYLFKAKKAGFVGTLDPFATGMLPICFGRSTKQSEALLQQPKRYRALLKLGKATSTGDIEGEIIEEKNIPALSKEILLDAFKQFTGDIMQVPPMYSALKYQGRPLYEYARKGLSIHREARPAKIFEIQLLNFSSNEIHFEVLCGKGVYIRTLAEDIAKHLNTCGHLIQLRRLFCSGFLESDMIDLSQLLQMTEEDLKMCIRRL